MAASGKTTPPGERAPDTLSDADLLAREFADVARLDRDSRVPLQMERPDPDLILRRRVAATQTPGTDDVPAGSLEAVSPIAAEARLEFHRPGLQLRQWQRLRQGAIAWDLGVDLHGTTREEALRAVGQLIRRAQEEQVNCLRIVHGKGHGSEGVTIKAELNHWLRRHEQVLAFCSALPGDGGAGALYVLLRRRRD